MKKTVNKKNPLKYVLIFLIACQLPAISVYQHEVSDELRQKEFSNNKQNLMLEGYDVVSYFKSSGPKKGSATHQTNYKGVTYYFVNDENILEFLKDSEHYEPLYGGWCAYAMIKGDKTEVNPESYKIVDGHLLLFYDGLFGDTLKWWNKKLKEGESEAALIAIADKEWEQILK